MPISMQQNSFIDPFKKERIQSQNKLMNQVSFKETLNQSLSQRFLPANKVVKERTDKKNLIQKIADSSFLSGIVKVSLGVGGTLSIALGLILLPIALPGIILGGLIGKQVEKQGGTRTAKIDYAISGGIVSTAPLFLGLGAFATIEKIRNPF